MRTPDAVELLRTWEHGVGKSVPVRAMLLMRSAVPEQATADLVRWNIGRRDALLLELRKTLFGSEVQCLTTCTRCSETIQLDFRIEEVRVSCGEPAFAYRAALNGYEVQFRLPDSADLFALEDSEPSEAPRQLFERCVLDVRTEAGAVDAVALPEAVVSAIGQKMSETDPQAEILLNVACPSCAFVSAAPFDIVSHLWAELDAWARRLLHEVHALAQSYGWSEGEILRMTPVRRRAYLDLLGA